MGGLMPKGIVTMSTKEIDRGELIRRVREKRLTQAKAVARSCPLMLMKHDEPESPFHPIWVGVGTSW